MEKRTLTEIAAGIDWHLRRLEADPVFNRRRVFDKARGGWVDATAPGEGVPSLYDAWARVSGNRIRVLYISYQGSSTLTRAEAETYLAWLDAGGQGRHFEALREAPRPG